MTPPQVCNRSPQPASVSRPGGTCSLNHVAGSLVVRQQQCLCFIIAQAVQNRGPCCASFMYAPGIWSLYSLCGVSAGANSAAEVPEDPLVKLDTTYVDLILAMETMFPTAEAGGPETATSASLHPIEEDARPPHAPAIEPLTVPTEVQPGQPVVDSHSPNV